MERVGSPSPPRNWEEAYELLALVVEEAAKRNLFATDRTDEEVQSSVVALLDVDDEVGDVAARLKAGPPEFLDLLILSPEDQRRQSHLEELLSKEAPSDSPDGSDEAAVDRVLEAHPEVNPTSTLEYEQNLMLVQEAIRQWGAREEEQTSSRGNYLFALGELMAGSAAWVLGLSEAIFEHTLLLLLGVVLIADATYRWHFYFLSRRDEGPQSFQRSAILIFRFALLIAVLLYSLAIGPWPLDPLARGLGGALGTVALLFAFRRLRAGRRH